MKQFISLLYQIKNDVEEENKSWEFNFEFFVFLEDILLLSFVIDFIFSKIHYIIEVILILISFFHLYLLLMWRFLILFGVKGCLIDHIDVKLYWVFL